MCNLDIDDLLFSDDDENNALNAINHKLAGIKSNLIKVKSITRIEGNNFIFRTNVGGILWAVINKLKNQEFEVKAMISVPRRNEDLPLISYSYNAEGNTILFIKKD
jgi:hypothetical protein